MVGVETNILLDWFFKMKCMFRIMDIFIENHEVKCIYFTHMCSVSEFEFFNSLVGASVTPVSKACPPQV
jgi:hypothetical protein